MASRRPAFLGVALAVVLTACSQSGDAASTTAPDLSPIGPEGGRRDLGSGVVVEAVAGTFGTPASFEVTPGSGAPLPAGATAVGEPVAVSASADPAAPLIVGLPLPAGAAPANLLMLHTDDAGEQQLLGGWLEGDTFFAAVPGLSEFQLVDYLFAAATSALPAGPADLPVIPVVTRVGQAGEWAVSEYAKEYSALARGSIEEAIPRFARVVGPGEVAVGETVPFAAIEFACFFGQFTEYAWQVAGRGLLIRTATPDGQVFVEGTAPGRALLTVTATDPLTGAAASASLAVTVVEEALTIGAFPAKALYFEDDDPGPQVYVEAQGGTPPYAWEWEWGDGEEGGAEGADLTIEHGAIAEDLSLTVTVTDGAGVQATAATAVRGLSKNRSDAAAVLAGPPSGAVGEALAYRILLWPVERQIASPRAELRGATGQAVVEDGTLRVTFAEPGLGFVVLMDDAAPDGQFDLAAAAVRVTGEAPPAEARFAAALPSAAPGVPAEVGIEVRGGVVANWDVGTRYTGDLDWGDGTVEPIQLLAISALDWIEGTVEHTWGEAGTFTVTLTIRTPDGQTAQATAVVEVSGDQRAVGKFEVTEIEGVPLEIVANRVVLVISGGELTIERLNLHIVAPVMGFTVDEGGNTITVPTDCTDESEHRLRSSDLRLNPDDGRIRGTVTVREVRDMSGPECPFGGGSHDLVRVGEATGTFRDGVITLELFFPTIEGAYETTLRFTARVG